ncbi:hypothetical protein [Phaeobacter sp. HF9A]|uniref:hypothetical protein n=1 Tax=Phaeobacter sp. HF9A TaxID=2721561 RepID=UPI001431AC34|nr:hypothetical protein [Phaeobacter sp. HF9A]NIZ13936.1 hypothetical protein [Phaeobacter sp. HF9A]
MNQFRDTPHQETTHGQSGVFATTGAEVPVGTGRAQLALGVRAAWTRFRKAERKFSDSIWGDALACVCLAIIFGGLLFAPLFWAN